MFPLLHRTLALAAVGLWLWAANVRWLGILGFNNNGVIPFDASRSDDDSSNRLFSVAAVASAWLLANVCAMSVVTAFSPMSVNTVMLVSLVLTLCILSMPYDAVFHKERYRFLRACRRIIIFGGWKHETAFGDLLLADIFTSYSRSFGDLFQSACQLLTAGSKDMPLSNTCTVTVLHPLFMLLPYCWRFRQCLADYVSSNGTNQLQLLNACKYMTALPVLATAFITHRYGYGQESWMPTAWIIFALINSGFSYYWDIVHDWDLGHLGSRYFMLRDQLTLDPISALMARSKEYVINTSHFDRLHDVSEENKPLGSPNFYYVVILFNLLARFSWAIRLYLIAGGVELDGVWSVFVLQLLELVRRWVWIFLRVEKHSFLLCPK